MIGALPGSWRLVADVVFYAAVVVALALAVGLGVVAFALPQSAPFEVDDVDTWDSAARGEQAGLDVDNQLRRLR